MAVAGMSGVFLSAKTGEASVLSFCEFRFAKGGRRLVCPVSEAEEPKGVSGVSVFVLLELLEQLAASRAVRASTHKTAKLRADVLFTSDKPSRASNSDNAIQVADGTMLRSRSFIRCVAALSK